MKEQFRPKKPSSEDRPENPEQESELAVTESENSDNNNSPGHSITSISDHPDSDEIVASLKSLKERIEEGRESTDQQP